MKTSLTIPGSGKDTKDAIALYDKHKKDPIAAKRKPENRKYAKMYFCIDTAREDEKAFAVFRSPNPLICIVVCADGMAFPLEQSSIYSGTVKRINHPDPIGLFLSVTQEGRDKNDVYYKGFIGHTNAYSQFKNTRNYAPVVISKGAREKDFTFFDETESLKQVTDIVEKWSREQSDPYILREDGLDDFSTWETEDVSSLSDIVRDVMVAYGKADSFVVLSSYDDEYNNEIRILNEDYEECNVCLSAKEVATEVVDVTKFYGYSWEYNDGALTRESGYDKSSKEVVVVCNDDISAHQTLTARLKILSMLDANGKATEILRKDWNMS